MKAFETRNPGFMLITIKCSKETAREAQELAEMLKGLSAKQNARRKRDGRSAMMLRIEINA